MAEEPKNDDVTPRGAVEVDESDLDQAAGGLSVSTSNIEAQFRPKPTAPADPKGCLNNKNPEL